MTQIFYSIYNDNDELLFANNTQYKTIADARADLSNVYKKLIKQKNIKILERTNDTIVFADLPQTELEGEEIHTFLIMKGVD